MSRGREAAKKTVTAAVADRFLHRKKGRKRAGERERLYNRFNCLICLRRTEPFPSSLFETVGGGEGPET